MGWEREIMHETVHRLCNNHPNVETGVKVLNVGFGLGIIDSFFQALPVPPLTHVIIEPHPDVLRYMRERGWYDRKGVTVLEGKWQDFVGTKMLEGMRFDAVYMDTFSEEYGDFLTTFQHSLLAQTPALASSTVWERPMAHSTMFIPTWRSSILPQLALTWSGLMLTLLRRKRCGGATLKDISV